MHLASAITGVTLTLLLLPAAADGQGTDPDGLSTAVEFRCSFTDMGLDFAVTEVNFDQGNRFGTAKIIGNLGSGNMTAVHHFMWHSLSFIEITFGGQVNMLTVYSRSRPGGIVDGGFQAVYTRHAADFEGRSLAQHEEGVCRVGGWRAP